MLFHQQLTKMEGGNGERAEASSLEASCALLEQRHVHDVYEKTAHHFRDTNYKAWPKVKQFLKSLDPGALVADIGESTVRYPWVSSMSHTFNLLIIICFLFQTIN